MAKSARHASMAMGRLSTAAKNNALKEMSRILRQKRDIIKRANLKDLRGAKRLGAGKAFLDRLMLDDKRIEEMSVSLAQVAELPDPVGGIIREWKTPSGLLIRKVRVPIGVIAIIYESRPNVTAECISLCFKSGNSLILRGGSEALNSNIAIYRLLSGVLKKYKLPQGAINLVASIDRRAIDILLKLNDYIDLVIPRGGEGLIRKVVRLSRIPVIKHYKGICHIYVDKWADLDMAQKVCFNAKVQRPGVCNAMECMLVHKDAAVKFLPRMIREFQNAGVQVRGCPQTGKIAKGARLAAEKDYRTEYLDLILSVKVVENLEEAIAHINHYGSHHSDAIISENETAAEKFLKGVDSACVYVNASTRFTDGCQFGLGAEIGISTDKLHARGPMALEELTTYKYQVYGKGQIRTT